MKIDLFTVDNVPTVIFATPLPSPKTATEEKLDKALALLAVLSDKINKPSDGHLTAREAAAYLGVAYSTFRGWTWRIKKQRTGRYRKEDLDTFAETGGLKRKRK